MTDLPDEETLRSRRGSADAAVNTPAAADEVGADTLPAEPIRRRATYTSADVREHVEGSTIIARRETRRRAARDLAEPGSSPGVHGPVIPAPTALARTASAPDHARVEAYRPRPAAPVVAVRSEAAKPVPQEPADGAAAAAAQRRRSRRTALTVLFSASAVVLAAGASLLAIALTP